MIGNYNYYFFYNNFFSKEKCSHGDVRLSGYKYYGQAQICFNGTWEAIVQLGYYLPFFINANVGKVVCQQLGFTFSGYQYSSVLMSYPHNQYNYLNLIKIINFFCCKGSLRSSNSYNFIEYHLFSSNNWLQFAIPTILFIDCTGHEKTVLSCQNIYRNFNYYDLQSSLFVMCQGMNIITLGWLT